ncbi:hypothetical protein JOC75_002264 [Metabacillus crassostreae]|uniref:adhesin n=1 Tax=Metabacillus crassostreae TaxID=929098 RepID=UPI00195D91AA|nr:adhesin [Metabacillus crassostreae]MBM7604291.1 hypothetical protein [Metabacillus crassostreae]
MKITNDAKEVLMQFLTEKGAEGIRLTSVAGCCGPQFTITLEAPMKSDKVDIINGITVAIDIQITDMDDLTLDIEEDSNGAGLVLLGASNCC